MSPGEDLVREALARLGCEGKGDALRETDELLEADPGRASALVDALLPALARAENGAGAAFLAAGAAFLALGDANRARELLQEGLAQLSPGEGGAAARGTLRLARAELALGNTREARAAVARSIGGVLALREDRLLAELGAVLEAAGDTAASTLLAHFRRERHEPGRETARLEVVGRMVRALNSSLLGTAEPLHAILRAVIEETGAQRGFLMLYADDGSPEGHPGNETLRFELGLSRDGRVLGASDFHYSTTIAAASLEEGRCVAIPDLWEARLPLAAASSAQEMGLRSALCAPLRAGRKRSGAGPDPAALAQVRGIAGVLYVDSPTAASFGEKDAPFFEALADGAALAVRAARTASALRTLMEEAERQRAKRPLVPRSTPEVALQHPYEEIVTRDPVMRSLLELLDRVVVSDANVVVRGESGTGKELVARALHRYGRRAKGPFVAIDCGAVPEGLVSSELFGHEAHAFTGAGPARAGLIERAHGGILFLDEVGEMSAAMQGALLRALQEGEVRRLGAERSRAFDVRIVAATHRDLRGMVERGELRHDLFFRLAAVEVRVPPLRKRRADIALLVEFFLAKISKASRRAPPLVEPAALARLEEHGWPGNVRELENVVQSLLLRESPTITLADVDHALAGAPNRLRETASSAVVPAALPQHLEGSLEELEKRAIRERLERLDWNQIETAASLGIDRRTLYRKIRRYGLGRGRGS